MLKVFLGYVVSVVVLLSSAYVFPTYATSAIVLITQIQAGAVGAATQEFIVIYNNSPEDVDISGWCLTNKSNVVITCFNGPTTQGMYLPPYTHATAVSGSLAITMPTGTVTSTYIPPNQSSGSITGSSDTISLIDHGGNVVDHHSWTTSLSAGMQFERHSAGTPIVYQDTDVSADWSVTLPGVLPVNETYTDTAIVDIDPVSAVVQIDITEILPNAAGSDEGHEFIELYNPNDIPIDLANYKLCIGPNYENVYTFPPGNIIQPHSYLSFSNNDIPFTLLNSTSRLLLALQDGSVLSRVPDYTDPKDDQSWAVIDGVWQYVKHPTPGAANVVIDASLDLAESKPELVSVPQPCAPNQYRSPETNRCRLISADTATVTPCKDNQYRSEETNRCRNIVSEVKTIAPCGADEERNLDTNRCRKIVTTTALAACKEGQERNPDTNRCRTMIKMPSANYGVLGAETKNSGNWYALAAIGGVLFLALGYAIWEWHEELGKFFRKLFFRVRQFARIHK